MPANKTKHTEASITALLRKTYSTDAWGFLSQVPNGTGSNQSRTCDGLAMSLWPSRGLYLHGIEIKVSRSDWLAEIQDETKVHAFAQYCHYWWIISPRGVVKLDEAAATWGVKEVSENGSFRVKKAATIQKPAPIDVDMLAGLFRACSRQGVEAEIKASHAAGYVAGKKRQAERDKEEATRHAKHASEEAIALQESVNRFEAASGIEIKRYDGERLGKLVARARAIGDSERQLALCRIHAQLALQATEADHA